MFGSLEPRLSVPDFVSQLWRKIFSKAARQNFLQSCETKFSPKLRDKIRNEKPGFEATFLGDTVHYDNVISPPSSATGTERAM